MVKTPFHEICLSTGIFCQECKEKADTKFSPTDVIISKLILDVLSRKREYDNLEYFGSAEGSRLLVLNFNETDLLESRPEVLDFLMSRIKEVIKKNIVITSSKESLRILVEKIAGSSAKIMYIRKLWLPDGSEAREVKIRGKLKFNPEEISKVLSKVLNEKVEISLEENI